MNLLSHPIRVMPMIEGDNVRSVGAGKGGSAPPLSEKSPQVQVLDGLLLCPLKPLSHRCRMVQKMRGGAGNMRDKGATRDWCGRAYDRQRASGRSRLTAEFSVGRTLGGKPPLNSSPWRRDPWRRGLFSGAPWNNLHHFRIVSVTDSPPCPPRWSVKEREQLLSRSPGPNPPGLLLV